jgi:MoaA/NifB/PqqE/SkfB family radical SAM enzyme
MKTLSMPFQVGWDVTHWCNFRCKHCLFSEEQLGDQSYLDRDEALAFVDHLIEKRVFHLSIAGGEPLLYPHIVDVVRRSSEGGVMVALSTNASLLSPALAKELFDAGLRSIQISLEGSNPDINDSIRGSGRFAKTIAGLKVAVEQGLSVYLAIVILKQNIGDIEKFLELAREIGVKGVKIQTLIDSGLALSNHEQIAVEPDRLRAKLIELWSIKSKYRGSLDIMLPLIPEVLGETFDEPEYYNRNSSCLGCQPGLSTVRINSHGDVRACGGMVDAPSIGNIRQTPLQDIWKESSELVKWRNASSLAEGETATSCGSICGKGCRSASAPAFAKEPVLAT